MPKKQITMRQRLLLSQYMKGFAAGADLAKAGKHVADRDLEMDRTWWRGHKDGRAAAHAAEEIEERVMLGELAPAGTHSAV
jgi:hypothetical protein